ncbi:MAG: hypothetical protein PVG39_01365 [Desulfobacteraceae bacterium]
MNDYSDRIGELVRGIDNDGVEGYGIYRGIENDQYKVVYLLSSDKKQEKYELFDDIEFLIPSVFRHYGKRVYVKNTGSGCERVQTIIAVSEDGSCLAVDDIERFERGCKCVLYDNYKLISDTTIITIDGKDHEVTLEQKEKIMEVIEFDGLLKRIENGELI